MKKTGLGEDPLSWIKDTKKGAKTAKIRRGPKKARKSELPKFRTLVKHTVFLSQDQIDRLHTLERAIMRGRKSGSERITKNTILRCYIEALNDLNFDTKNISDEKELLSRIKAKLNL